MRNPAGAIGFGIDEFRLAAERGLPSSTAPAMGAYTSEAALPIRPLQRRRRLQDSCQLGTSTNTDPERTLRVVGYAHFDIAVRQRANPLMRLGVLEIGGMLLMFLLRKKNPNR